MTCVVGLRGFGSEKGTLEDEGRGLHVDRRTMIANPPPPRVFVYRDELN